MPVVETTLLIRKAAIHVRQSRGDGLPIVLLHGSGSSGAVFARQFESSLADEHRLIAIDLPGHGRSDDAADPASTYTITGLAETVAAALDQLRLDRALIFGWSLGGHVGLQLASTHPAIAGLFLSGAPPIAPGPIALLRAFHANWDVFLASKKVFTERDIDRFEKLCFGGTGDPAFRDLIRRADGRMRVHFFRSLLRGDGIDEKKLVETSDLPLAIVNGTEDPFIRLGYVEAINYRALWHGRCHTIEGTGHTPFWHAPRIVNPLLASFADFVAAHAGRPAGAVRRTAAC